MQRGRGSGYYYPNPRNINRRGRGEPAVEDLREKLNRMKLEKEKAHGAEGVKNPPPPDPVYNFLKDPLRGDNCAHSSNENKVGNKDQNKSETKVESKEIDNDQKNSAEANENTLPKHRRSVRFVENFKTPSLRSGPPRPNWETPYRGPRPHNFMEKNNQISKQQSVNNIKVEVLSESGERKCTFDYSKTIEIPVIPKKNYTVRPRSGRWSYRGTQRYYSGRYNKPRTGFQTIPSGNVQESKQRGNNRYFKSKRRNQNENQAETQEASANNVTVMNKKDQVNEIEITGNKTQTDTETISNEETKAGLETKIEPRSTKENLEVLETQGSKI
ncbi:hypothetical protein ILUMI_06548 [Ignelater luminosus]|uniref:Uncharacterized protein n=1 Tax=Ignelater luminosus TaxID=2038154 RepID=A0A8K0D908_IGNLU|nr:hypothetical protein ILUMI_06548 [Ignelater luminosus]